MDYVSSVHLRSLEVPEIEGIWLKIVIDSTAPVLGTLNRPPSNERFFQHFNSTYPQGKHSLSTRMLL